MSLGKINRIRNKVTRFKMRKILGGLNSNLCYVKFITTGVKKSCMDLRIQIKQGIYDFTKLVIILNQGCELSL